MNQFWRDMGIAAVMGLIVPAVLLAGVVSVSSEQREIPEVTESTPPSSAPTETVDQTMMILVQNRDGSVVEMELNSYLTCVVLAEMPVSFEAEALKAQSVVARTYALRAMSGASKHENAAVCMNSGCCQGYMSSDDYVTRGGNENSISYVRNLVDATDGDVLTYDGELIEATYFSCSGGTTEDAVAVWGTDVPYLQSVSSPGEERATYYTDTVSFTASDFSVKLGGELKGKPSSWFGTVTYTEGGGVEFIEIGGVSYKGTQLRKLLGLRSTAFEITTDGDTIYITTRGYGHRVGMSQYGADAMAASGSNYVQILTYYYQGTKLTKHAD